MLISREYTSDQKTKLWKWLATSNFKLGGRYAQYGDPNYDEDAEEQKQYGYYVTYPDSGYRVVKGQGLTEEDAIAGAVIACAYSNQQIQAVTQADKIWFELVSFGETERIQISNEEVKVLVNVWLRRNKFEFLEE